MNNPRVEGDNYDPHITPAETAARKEREGNAYKHKPTDDSNKGDVKTDDGYTVDREGLVNNFAVEPEMYYEVPGDRREIKAAEKAAREEELHAIQDNEEQGKLTMEEDKRSKGPGIV